MPKKPRGKPPSQRPGHLPGGAHRQKPLQFDGGTLDVIFAKTVSPTSPAPVVFLINADDEVGGKLGREMLGRELVAEIAEDFRHTPYATSLTLGVESVEGAVAILSFSFENASADLETPLPPGHYRLVIVDRGGMACRSRPIPRYEITGENTIHLNPS
jgi:hypothetical protein